MVCELEQATFDSKTWASQIHSNRPFGNHAKTASILKFDSIDLSTSRPKQLGKLLTQPLSAWLADVKRMLAAFLTINRLLLPFQR